MHPTVPRCYALAHPRVHARRIPVRAMNASGKAAAKAPRAAAATRAQWRAGAQFVLTVVVFSTLVATTACLLAVLLQGGAWLLAPWFAG